MARGKRDQQKEELAQRVLAEYGATTAQGAQEALRDLLGPMIEAMLRAELDQHLGYASNERGEKASPNRRNGYTPKRVRAAGGEVPISVPRDRDGSFEPTVVPKGSRDVSDIEERVISMYARGMSVRDISATVREIYGFSVSAETVSAITDAVVEELEAWRSRPLEAVYPFLFVDCLYVSVRREGRARRAAVYVAVAYDLRGRKDVLGVWLGESEGAHRWMQVFDELRGRGVEDVLFVCSDGVVGLAEGLRAVFPRAEHQRCVVHLVRNSTRFVPHSRMKEFCADARAFYAAPSLEACGAAFQAFRAKWSAEYPSAVAVWERSLGSVEALFDHGSEVRRIMYTTNAVESVNSSFRKVTKRGSLPTEEAVYKLLYLRVRELYRSWGEGCHQRDWPTVINQLLCEEGMRERIEAYV